MSEYKIGEIIQFGGYDWRVLDVQDGKALILSDKVIEESSYNNKYEKITWEACDLRRYLNGNFYAGFGVEERARIIETRLENKSNPWHGTYSGKDTACNIFLLSLEEVARYLGDTEKLKGKNPNNEYWVDDPYNAARTAQNVTGNNSSWWLRSSGVSNTHAAFVNDKGNILVGGKNVIDNDCGVRPALWLKI